MLKILLLIMSLGIYAQAAATELIYCPSTGQYVSTGISKEMLINQCGQPQEKHEGTENVTVDQPVQLWHYQFSILGEVYDLTLTVQNNLISAIQINALSVQSTDLCREGRMVRVGDNVNTAQRICGRPRFISNSTIQEDRGPRKAAVWIYQFNEYQPKVYFKFEDGILTTIAQ